MTFKECFLTRNPLEEWRFNRGCTPGCPHEFALELENESVKTCKEMSCAECWDRQMPEFPVYTVPKRRKANDS